MKEEKLIVNVYGARKKGQNFVHIFLRDLFSNRVEDFLIPLDKNTKISGLRKFFSEKRLDPLGIYRLEESSGKLKLYKERILKFEEFLNLKNLAFDLEALNPHRLPDPERDPIVSLAYTCGKEEGIFFGEEEEILRNFREVVRKEKPFFLITFNGDGFDNPYLLRRAKILNKQKKLEKNYTLSPYDFSPKSLTLPTLFSRSKGISYPGIFTLDLLYLAKLMPLAQTNLDFLARTFGLKSEKIEIKDLFRIVERGEIELICKHNLGDARVTREIWKLLAKSIYLISRNVYGSLEYITRAINSLPELLVDRLCVRNRKEPRKYNLIGKEVAPPDHLIVRRGFYPKVKVFDFNLEIAERLPKIYRSMESWVLENLFKLYNSRYLYGFEMDEVTKLVLEGLIKKSILFFEKVHPKFDKLVKSMRRRLQDEFLSMIPKDRIVYVGRDFGIYESEKGDRVLITGNSFFIKKGDYILSNSTPSKLVKNSPLYTSKTLAEAIYLLLEGKSIEQVGNYVLRRRKDIRNAPLKELILLQKKRGLEERILPTEGDRILDSLNFPYEEGTHVEVVMTKSGPKDVNREKIKRDEIDWKFYEKNFDEAMEKIGRMVRYQNGALIQSLFAYM